MQQKERQNKCICTYKKSQPFIYIVNIAVVLRKKEYTNVSHSRIIKILFHEHAVYERGTK